MASKDAARRKNRKFELICIVDILAQENAIRGYFIFKDGRPEKLGRGSFQDSALRAVVSLMACP